MTGKMKTTAVFLVLLSTYVLISTKVNRDRQELIDDRFVQYTMPSEFLKPMSLEFKGVASDLLLVKFMTFIGARTDQLNNFSATDWDAVRDTLETITDLDPYYWDAYMFAQMFLTWDQTHYTDANNLLEKARQYIPDNYRIPYYIGLNYYNFGKDMEKGSQYMMAASRIEGCPPYIKTLAARLAAYSSDYERGIIFLNEMLKQTKSPEVAEQYKLRMELLERMQDIDRGIHKFREIYGRQPSELSDLVANGVIQSIPKDPYGGEFYLTEEGKINTTSKMQKK